MISKHLTHVFYLFIHALILCFVFFYRDFVSDFEIMMMKKKEESQKYRRKRRDVDIINDNDDLIADMINKMKTAAEVRIEHTYFSPH